MVVGIAVLATNLVAAGWGVIGWLRKDARASIVFWPLLRVAQATVVVQAVVGLLLRGPRRVGARRPAHRLRGRAARSSRWSARRCARASRSASSRAWRTWTRSSARSRWRSRSAWRSARWA